MFTTRHTASRRCAHADHRGEETCLRRELARECARHGDNFDGLVTTATDAELDARFVVEFGRSRVADFTAWTPTRVYFPWVYDGKKGVTSVPRHPCDEATEAVGGE